MNLTVAVTGAIATVGLCLLGGLGLLIRRALHPRRLARHRSNAPGMADLLGYAVLIDDGVVLGKDGSLMAAFRYRCEDIASSTEEERQGLSDAINRALLPLGSGWMIHVDAVRQVASRPTLQSAFPDPVTAAIDEERRRYFDTRGTAYEGFTVLTVTYLAPAAAHSRLLRLMFDDGGQAPDHPQQGQELLTAFKRDLRALQARLPMRLQRLRSHVVQTPTGPVQHDDLLRWLHHCVTGKSHPIALPDCPVHLDLLIGGQDLWGGLSPRVGDQHLRVVALEGLPLGSCPGMLTALSELPCEYRWSSRFICLDPHEAEEHLQKYRRRWRQQVRGIVDGIMRRGQDPEDRKAPDRDAERMVDDAEEAIADTKSGRVGQGYYTSVIVLMDHDEDVVRRAAEQTYRVITRIGFSTARIEDVNALEAYLGSLPGHGVQNVRRPLINTQNLADLLPTSTIWAGERSAPCPLYPQPSPPLMECLTTGYTPFFLNLHVRDVGHTLLFGPTGAGKSTHLAVLAAQLRRYPGMRVFAFDKGMGLYPLLSAIRTATAGRDGLHLPLGGDSEHGLSPLQNLSTRADRAWAAQWAAMVVELSGVTLSPAQRNEIGSAVLNMHDTSAGSLSDLVSTLQDRQLREALQPYTVAGSMGHLLDGLCDGLSLSDFTVFETGELLSLGDRFALPVLWYLFRRIEQALDGRPAAIILDEAWVMLGHPVFREKVRGWLKELRKHNCLVILATQQLSDATRSGILDVLVESCPTKIFLPNRQARTESVSALYRSLGLNAVQIQTIAEATPKRHYYYVSEHGRRLYELALGPLALALCAAPDKERLTQLQAMQAQIGDGWLSMWLAQRGAPALQPPEAA